MRHYFSSIISFACLILISGSASAQINAEQLRVCTKEQQKQLFDTIVAKEIKENSRGKGDHRFNFMTSDLRAHSCVALDSSKEIYLENSPVLSSEPPYDGSKEPQVIVHISAEGYINLAYIGYETKSGEIDLAKKINHASAEELEKYKKEFEFIADFLGIIQAGNIKQRMREHDDSVSVMAKKNLLRQKNILCQQSRIGNLVIKPLLKNGIADYSGTLTLSEAREKMKTNEAIDFVEVNGGMFDPVNEIKIERVRVWNNDSIARLSYLYDSKNNKCSYRFSYKNNSEKINHSFVIGQGGLINSPDSSTGYSDPEMAKSIQELADRVLKYFE